MSLRSLDIIHARSNITMADCKRDRLKAGQPCSRQGQARAAQGPGTTREGSFPQGCLWTKHPAPVSRRAGFWQEMGGSGSDQKTLNPVCPETLGFLQQRQGDWFPRELPASEGPGVRSCPHHPPLLRLRILHLPGQRDDPTKGNGALTRTGALEIRAQGPRPQSQILRLNTGCFTGNLFSRGPQGPELCSAMPESTHWVFCTKLFL